MEGLPNFLYNLKSLIAKFSTTLNKQTMLFYHRHGKDQLLITWENLFSEAEVDFYCLRRKISFVP